MKREGQTVTRCKQPIKIEKPLHCSRYFLASFVKEITLSFPKLKQALCSQPFKWYKTAVLDSKSRTGTRQTKKSTISNYVCLLFVLSQCGLQLLHSRRRSLSNFGGFKPNALSSARLLVKHDIGCSHIYDVTNSVKLRAVIPNCSQCFRSTLRSHHAVNNSWF